jgi:hypothetical protein
MLRGRKRSVLLSREKPRRITQDYAIDEFGELAARKRMAMATARKHGHDMKAWHRRPNDAAGRWNSYCCTCNKAAVVCTEAPEGVADAYGPALTVECGEEGIS